MVGIRSPDGLVVGVLPTDAEAQGPAARAPRSRLQLGLHAHACSSHCTLSVQQACYTSRDPLRDEIRKVGRGLSLIDTQTGRYGRIYSRRRLCARCSADAESSFDLVELVRLRCSKHSSRTQLSKQLSVPGTGTGVSSRANDYSGGVLARALPEGLRYLSMT